jgi:flavin-dependent dehydrogenase
VPLGIAAGARRRKLRYDVAIIGASTAGLYAAEQLARAGLTVGVFERQPELQPARRTYIITPHLRRLLGYEPESAVLHSIRFMDVATPNAFARVELGEPDVIIERSQLTYWLRGRALEAGATLHSGYRFQEIHPHSGGAKLGFGAPDRMHAWVTAGAVIGADGVTSDVARVAGLGLPPRVPIVQAEVRLPPDWDPEVTQVWFDVGKTRFFFWLIPESPEVGVAGLVGDAHGDTRALLREFLEHHRLEPLAYQSAQVAMHHPRLRPEGSVGGAPVLLVGDAAGQVKVTTVGGTVTGLWGAKAAARALLNGSSYARELRPVKRELDLHWALRLVLERLDNRGYDTVVWNVNRAVRDFLGQYNRDEMARAIWRLPLLRPHLVWIGLKALLPGPRRSVASRRALVPEMET